MVPIYTNILPKLSFSIIFSVPLIPLAKPAPNDSTVPNSIALSAPPSLYISICSILSYTAKY